MRYLLGDERLHYFGVSYGTALGAVYAHLYPSHVGRLVLEASVDPSEDLNEEQVSQGGRCAGAACPEARTDPPGGRQHTGLFAGAPGRAPPHRPHRLTRDRLWAGTGAVVGAERPDDAQAGCEVAPGGLGHSDVVVVAPFMAAAGAALGALLSVGVVMPLLAVAGWLGRRFSGRRRARGGVIGRGPRRRGA
ncbi:alpha/beta fold hydrolase, partial [Micromonospora sp. NPDC023888]|uniref:alpha/beta fold hydrolase n=1 Tax=Micromonospora sp. NPDC023888 TaxID=3155607 RepID=UPI0033D90BBA